MSRNLEHWHQHGHYIEVNGHRVFYRDEGAGPAILLIHGYPTASWDWNKIWQPLTEGYRCIALDMLGFGFSDKPTRAYSIFEQADICVALLEHLEVSECHIVSHDYGDTVAQELLAKHNEGTLVAGIRSIVLLNGGIFPEVHQPVLIQKLFLSPIGGLLSRLMSRATLAKNFNAIFGADTPPSDQEIDEFWQLIAHNNGKRVMHRIISYMPERRAHRERWVGALQSTDVPLRFVNGLADPISGGHMVDRYAELIPNADLVRLDNIGHYPQVEAPEAVLQSIREKLSAVN
ncbi:MAG: alpha/beta hydrolase [Pseudomonadota bacterium]